MQRQLLTRTKASAALDFRMVASLPPASPHSPHTPPCSIISLPSSSHRQALLCPLSCLCTHVPCVQTPPHCPSHTYTGAGSLRTSKHLVLGQWVLSHSPRDDCGNPPHSLSSSGWSCFQSPMLAPAAPRSAPRGPVGAWPEAPMLSLEALLNITQLCLRGTWGAES